MLYIILSGLLQPACQQDDLCMCYCCYIRFCISLPKFIPYREHSKASSYGVFGDNYPPQSTQFLKQFFSIFTGCPRIFVCDRCIVCIVCMHAPLIGHLKLQYVVVIKISVSISHKLVIRFYYW